MAKIVNGFKVKGNKISYTQMHKGDVVFGVAQVADGDKFNLELGKAIAYARCDLMMRNRELDMALATKDFLEEAVPLFQNRFFNNYLQDIVEQIAHMKHMIRNQKKMIELLCKDGELLAGQMEYRDILRKTLRIVLDNIQYK